jgi:hypothetical protein
MEPGELMVIESDTTRAETPLVLASHGREANLADKRRMIDAARSAGRPVEIHVFETPGERS